ncbi:TlpA family protein disulfide reductase [Candidatus Nitrosacidococcus tergens]|uniref:Thioredoxin domain-containing protein n=1 Tax=Candidatus Nitrosacidococcus tergens TaxID=553981 RepID=A0A7G1Q970_9GAMM|nr:redoxin domain-containing protein [Candidatus Nitrosacidococcus tergens]CAB1275643.1 conserved protein of unknown function [Candidatus Nitrosacidococcus tergens]
MYQLLLSGLFILGLPFTTLADNLPDNLLNAPIHLISGKTTSLADFKGEKPVFLKFWATWCQPCRAQMPHYQEQNEKYGNKIRFIGINLGIDDDIDSINKTIKEFSLTMDTAIDRDNDLSQKFHLIGTPYLLLFDKNMQLVAIGHDADEAFDNKLALLSQNRAVESISPNPLITKQSHISINAQNGKTYGVFFTATWCDWYLKDSRPEVSNHCIQAQNLVNNLATEYPNINWLGVVSDLWTEDKDVADYKKLYKIPFNIEIDQDNQLFYQYHIEHLGTLILIKDGKILAEINDFEHPEKIQARLAEL